MVAFCAKKFRGRDEMMRYERMKKNTSKSVQLHEQRELGAFNCVVKSHCSFNSWTKQWYHNVNAVDRVPSPIIKRPWAPKVNQHLEQFCD